MLAVHLHRKMALATNTPARDVITHKPCDSCPHCRHPQIHALLNCVSSSVTAFLNTTSFLWHVCATVALCTGLLLTAQKVNSPAFVLTTWTPNTEKHGKGAKVLRIR